MHDARSREGFDEFGLYALVAAEEHGEDRRRIFLGHHALHRSAVCRAHPLAPPQHGICLPRLPMNSRLLRRETRAHALDRRRALHINAPGIAVAVDALDLPQSRDFRANLGQGSDIFAHLRDIDCSRRRLLLAALAHALCLHRIAHERPLRRPPHMRRLDEHALD